MRPPGREGVITAAIAREVSACLTILRLWTEENGIRRIGQQEHFVARHWEVSIIN